MARPEDENYWTSSRTKGFDFDSEDLPQDSFSALFGVTPSQTAQLSKQVQETIPQPPPAAAHMKVSHSLSSISSEGSSSTIIRTSQPTSRQCELTCKLLSSTINVETILSPKDVIRSIFLGMPYDLSCFKKLSDKAALLDEAVKLGDGDVTTAVLLFLQKTLHQSVLFDLLKERQIAARQYLDILEKQKSLKEAAVLCAELQRPKEAVIHLYNTCLAEADVKHILLALDSLHKSAFYKSLSGVEMEDDTLNEHVKLLERLSAIALDSSHSHHNASETTVLCPLIGPPFDPNKIVASSLMATLQYCCRYHWGVPENILTSPAGIRKNFHMTDRQFVWNAFIGRLLAGQDPLPILVVKGLFGAPKLTTGLSIPRILEIGSKLNSQPNLYDQILPLVDSSDERCRLAKRYQRHRIVIDVLASNKDRLGLLKYRDSINEKNEIDYVNNILRVSSTRWKN